MPVLARALPAPRPHPAAVRVGSAAPAAGLAFLPVRVRCATCFGPLHGPDVSFAPTSAAAPPATFAAAPAAVAEETGSGPAAPGAGMLWLHLPRAVANP